MLRTPLCVSPTQTSPNSHILCLCNRCPTLDMSWTKCLFSTHTLLQNPFSSCSLSLFSLWPLKNVFSSSVKCFGVFLRFYLAIIPQTYLSTGISLHLQNRSRTWLLLSIATVLKLLCATTIFHPVTAAASSGVSLFCLSPLQLIVRTTKEGPELRLCYSSGQNPWQWLPISFGVKVS